LSVTQIGPIFAFWTFSLCLSRRRSRVRVPSLPSQVSVTLTASDSGGSGVKETRYAIGTDPTATTSSPIYDPAAKPVLSTGQKISYLSIDQAGNVESAKRSATVTAPPPPTPPAATPNPTLALAPNASSRLGQLLLDKRGITLQVSCGSTACAATARGTVRLDKKLVGALTGPTRPTPIPASRTITLTLKSTIALRRKVRKALKARKAKAATITITATFTTPDSTTSTRTLTIQVRRLRH